MSTNEPQGLPIDLNLTATLSVKKRFLEALVRNPDLVAELRIPDRAREILKDGGIDVGENSTVYAVEPLPTPEELEDALRKLEEEARRFIEGGETVDEYGSLLLILNSDPKQLRISLGYAMPFVADDDGEG